MMRAEHVAFLVSVTAASACGGERPREGFEGAGAPDAGGGGGGGGVTGGLTGSGEDGGGGGLVIARDGGMPPAGDGCSEEAKHVYVVSSDRELYSFWPPTLTFTKLGTLSCDPSSGPFSMAVDRGGTAWVLYKTGHIYRVSTKDGSCTPTAFDPVAAGVDKFGMGFSSNAGGSSEETLFLATFSGLGRIDTSTMKVSMIGSVSGPVAGQFGELTGTGDGRLYGFFYGAPASLNQIDKTAAKAGAAAPLGELSTGSAFAFSFWGGDFYLYTANAGDTARPLSDVTRFRPSDGTLTTVKSQIGFRIVGAGVSTCAPVQPPK